jgi:SnoaL-like domain
VSEAAPHPSLAAEVWHRQLDAGRSGNWAERDEILAPDCVWSLRTQGAAFRGRDDVVAFIQEGFDAAATHEKPDVCTDFSTADWGVYEYISRGTIDPSQATKFAKRLIPAPRIITNALAPIITRVLSGKTFAVPICFVYHVSSDGLIDQVNEYVGKRTNNNPRPLRN